MTATLFCRAILILCLALPAPSLCARIYTDNKGRTLEAEILSMEGNTVHLIRDNDGQSFTLPVEIFSVKDRNFILNEQNSGRLTANGYTGLNLPKIAPVIKSPLHANASLQIDKLLSEYWATKGVQPEPIVDDPTYLRRAYLKIIGRIPTYAEAVHFLNDSSPDKRSRLVDRLLDSPGYVSHNFNLWADILRVKSTGSEGGRQGGIYYVPWLKDQLRANVPYDDFVASLLTAEGYPWDNPAVGYYLRDLGMPLDNMAMTAQIFLGTQLQCAQCHNHPTDKWTQKDFYQLSAFTTGIDTRINIMNSSSELRPIIRELRQLARSEKGAEDAKLYKSNLMRVTQLFLDPLKWGVAYSDRDLQLPHDYQYDDAAPNSPVQPHVIFGELAATELHGTSKRVESYADWMVSKNNARFTKVIANRMWKHTMGKGLIEPIDNLTDDSVADAPELLKFLQSLMQSVDYDLKQYLRVLYNTDYFQRAAVIDNPDLDDDYHLEGPIFQRMSSEQIWDSIATLMTPDIDQIYNPGYKARTQGTQYDSNNRPKAAAFVEEKSTKEVVEHIAQITSVYENYLSLRTQRNAMRSDPQKQKSDEYKAVRKAFKKAQSEWYEMMNPAVAEDEAVEHMGMTMMMANASSHTSRNEEKWLKDIRRASELESPQANGHLLEVFGQSDRMLIENADDGSNILQALFLMNSWQTNGLLTSRSAPVLEARLAPTPEAKIETLYIGFLSRKPTQAEQNALIDYFKEDPEKARQRIIWAMLNTQQFLFIQ